MVTNKEKIQELVLTSPYASFSKEAPLVFVACSRKAETREQQDRYEESCVHYLE